MMPSYFLFSECDFNLYVAQRTRYALIIEEIEAKKDVSLSLRKRQERAAINKEIVSIIIRKSYLITFALAIMLLSLDLHLQSLFGVFFEIRIDKFIYITIHYCLNVSVFIACASVFNKCVGHKYIGTNL